MKISTVVVCQGMPVKVTLIQSHRSLQENNGIFLYIFITIVMKVNKMVFVGKTFQSKPIKVTFTLGQGHWGGWKFGKVLFLAFY